ncbi:hypothetical protein B7P43_G04113 [Cryptotermes secundus]|uniref:Syntaxin N-terminal domain-containing protein n=1 Tax=Cryptotermes secundus TaxID=105785 RepID=A0A2J7R3S4_9NEOP|nr:hypothetical protein B7P43_G04113 [Cryptotermes secundus]
MAVLVLSSMYLLQLIVEINSQVALFRDLLIHVGQARDSPELREKIRKLRRTLVDACRHTSQLLLPQVRSCCSAVAEGIPADNQHFVLLFFIAQLFLRELAKCYRLVQVIPMDMTGYYENRPGPSNLGNVISQILLCKQITPDFRQEELCSITKDSQDVRRMVQDMQEFMPQQENNTERNQALIGEDTGGHQWTKNRSASFYKNMGSFCCICRPNYL